MIITINGEKFTIFDNDDDTTILERYSLKFHSSKPSLPSYFRIVNKDFVLEENLELEVEDVRNLIIEMKQSDLADETEVGSVLNKYPRLLKKEIGYLWIILHPKVDIKLEYFKGLDRYSFSTLHKASSTVEEYKKDVENFNKVLDGNVKKENAIFDKIAKIKATPVQDFSLEEISIEVSLELEQKNNILDIFDALTVSQNIPFISLVYKKKKFFKVFTQRIPPDSWIETLGQEEGIYFKILNMPPSKITSKKIHLENLYANGFWSIENNVYFTFKVRDEDAEKTIRNKIFKSLDSGIKYKIKSTRQIGIRGTFLVKNFEIERFIFADLICTNDLFKRFLFLDEKGSGRTIKTVMTKDRLFVHYTSSRNDQNYSLGITITPVLEVSSKSLSIRISGAQNFQQANGVVNTFSKLFSVYTKEAPSIRKVYETIIPSSELKLTNVIKKVVKKDLKTGRRAAALAEHDPELFKKRYPDQCQKQQQPEVVTEEEAKKAIKNFVKGGLNKQDAVHKVMFFNNSYYICDPRDPEDRTQTHLWPGLKVNKSKDEEYREKFPLLPCCYKFNQYTKNASQLRKYMAESSTTEDKKGAAEHVLGSNKLVPEERYGEMPFNWEKIFKYIQLKKVKKGRQKEFYPILRYGVKESPSSFIYCLERAFNKKYSTLNGDELEKRILQIRNEVSEQINNYDKFNIGKQELYDYTNKAIVDILNDPDQYVAPEMFVSIFEKYYNCNIFLYIVNTEFPNGEVLIPRHSQAYLTKTMNPDKETVLIVKYEVQGKDIPYQCELVSFMDVKEGKTRDVKYKFEGSSKIVKIATKMFYDTNEVYIVNSDGVEPYVK